MTATHGRRRGRSAEDGPLDRGAADCTAKLYSMDSGSKVVLKAVTFHVDA